MKNKAFTLIELLIAVATVGIISVVSVNLLFSTVLNRTRQNSIQYASEDVRNFMELLSKSVKESTKVELVSSTQIKITGAVCRTFYLDGTAIKLASDTTPTCTPPATSVGDLKITDANTSVSAFTMAKTSNSVTTAISGVHTDAFGKHDFSYNTAVISRVSQ